MDTNNNSALLPVPVENTEIPEEEAPPENAAPSTSAGPVRPKHHPAEALRTILVSFFSAISLSAFGICTYFAVSSADFDPYLPVRLMMGEYFGGYGNIEITLPEKLHADYSTSHITENNGENAALPSDPIADDLSEEKSPAADRTHITLASDSTGLTNETPYRPDTEILLDCSRIIPSADKLYELYGNDAPLVLIVHTHGTEAFAECADEGYRSTDTAENIVSCGKVISEILESRGIHTIHSETMFDEEDFSMAYYSASLEIKKITEMYPSVSYIIDIHRDSIVSEELYMAPSAEKDGELLAQMMFVVGTDHGGSGHSTWQNNLSLALRLQDSLNKETPQIMRTINLRSASFNQQYSDGSLLLEIGACGSSLEEVHRSAEMFADALADEILG